MMRLPICEICDEEIVSNHRYNLGSGVYICPDCMHENMVKALRILAAPIADKLDDMSNDWLETNDTVYCGEVDPAEELYFDLVADAYQI